MSQRKKERLSFIYLFYPSSGQLCDWIVTYTMSSRLTGDEWDYIMSEVQGTLEFSVELHKFHNVDLFQRG